MKDYAQIGDMDHYSLHNIFIISDKGTKFLPQTQIF